MAVTKILARNARLDQAIQYVLNGDKTDHQILTAHQNCDPDREYRQMMDTKREVGKLDGRQCYHIIQSFKPGEITPELALEIAKEFAAEYLADYEVVIGTHVDKGHIHSHLVFNSVNAQTGEKYHITTQEYYRQIRAVSDQLCREHGLSVIMEGQPVQAVSYIEWLRQSRGQPTFRSMLEADLRTAIEDANDLGHFFMLMEHLGWEISHGSRLSFRLRGQERFMIPGRKNPLFTEDGIRAAILGNLEKIEAGRRPEMISRPRYQPYQKHPKYTGLMALYVHYLYILGKIEKRQYPPRMTPRLRKEVMRFDRIREQFLFLRGNNITTSEGMASFQERTEETLDTLTKQRTILNVRKKKRKKLYNALADTAALAQVRELYDEGLSGMETEFSRYMEARAVLERCGVSLERLTAEKAGLYEQLAQVNREIRSARKKLALCEEIQARLPQMQRTVETIEAREAPLHGLEFQRRRLTACPLPARAQAPPSRFRALEQQFDCRDHGPASSVEACEAYHAPQGSRQAAVPSGPPPGLRPPAACAGPCAALRASLGPAPSAALRAVGALARRPCRAWFFGLTFNEGGRSHDICQSHQSRTEGRIQAGRLLLCPL